MVTSAEDFDNSIDCSQKKKQLLQDEIGNLKKNIDSLEETVSRGILNLRDLKNRDEEATNEAISIE